MEALAVSSELPWPLDSGGHLRSFHLLRALSRQYTVHLVTSAARDAQATTEAVTALQARGIHVTAAASRRSAIREGMRAARMACQGQPYVLYGRHESAGIRRDLAHLTHRLQPRIVYLDHLDSFLYAPPISSTRTVLDLHNIYSLIARRAAIEARGLRRGYLQREAGLLQRIERDAVCRADVVFAVSNQECDYYRRLGGRNVHLVPNGVDTQAYEDLPAGRRDSHTILYLGALSWPPNADAARYLATEVLPALQRVLPQARLQIVGKDPTPEILALPSRIPGVSLAASVPDVRPYLEAAAVMAVPLDVGGGTRLKILEALAAGVPIVTSVVGAEGLALQHNRELLIAERPEFAQAIRAVLLDRDLGGRLASAGRAVVRSKYDWDTIGRAALAAIEHVP